MTVEFCNLFRIVEKPYYVIFASCWVCALMQQLIDTSRYYEERHEELSKTQKCYVGIQLLTLVMETLAIVGKIDWLAGESLWHMYNLYVYVFVHSSVFVRSIMMSMIIWDWLLARLLGRPVFGAEYDGQGWRDWHRAVLLIIIMQFGSSVFVMMVVTLTHAIPALIIYYPVFLLAAAFIIKFRSWLELLGLNPDGRAGRGLVMASNSFVAVVSIQTMIASIIRVYFGDAWSQGYLAPLKDDVASRSSKTFYECHLRAGMGVCSRTVPLHDMAEETSALAHQRAVSPSFRPLTLRSAEEGKAAPRQKLRPASAPSGRGRECSPAHDRHRRKKPLACAPHRFSADLQAWGHHRTQSINKAVMARKEREQTMLGSYPERPRVSKNMKTFALSAFSMYPIMPFLAAMPQRSQGRTPARVSTQ